MKMLFFALVVVILCGCKERNSNKPVPNDIVETKKDTLKKISIKNVGKLHFRRSYAANQFREMSDNEYKKIERSNPTPDFFNDSLLMKKFQEIGLVNKEDALLRHKFRSNKTKDFELTEQDEKIISCKIVRPSTPDKYNLYNLVVTDGNQYSEIEIEGHYGITNNDIKYLLFNIIPGGYKEIIVLEEYYIMNGDNSDIYIYEIKYN